MSLIQEIRSTIHENVLRHAMQNLEIPLEELVVQLGPAAYRRFAAEVEWFEVDADRTKFRGVRLERVPDLEGWRLVQVLPAYG